MPLIDDYQDNLIDLTAPEDVHFPKATEPFESPTSAVVQPGVQIFEEPDPITWEQLLASRNKAYWLAAVEQELKAHDVNQTFEECAKLVVRVRLDSPRNILSHI